MTDIYLAISLSTHNGDDTPQNSGTPCPPRWFLQTKKIEDIYSPMDTYDKEHFDSPQSSS